MISGGDAFAGMYKSEQVFIVLQKTIGRLGGSIRSSGALMARKTMDASRDVADQLLLFLVRDPSFTQGGTTFDAMVWSFVAMVSALIAAGFGAIYQPSKKFSAVFLAFSCGLLISLLCFDLMQVALEMGGIVAAMSGFFLGLLTYVLINRWLAQRGVKSRCSVTCGGLGGANALNAEQREEKATAMALVFGAALDGIPESMSIGLALLDNPLASTSVVFAVAVANLPEGLASGAGLRRSGLPVSRILVIWSCVVAVCVIAAGLAHSLMESAPDQVKAMTTAFAGGGVLAMTLQTVIPEAYVETHDGVSVLGGLGFAMAFCIVFLFH